MAFPSELEAFQAYAGALPNNVTLLVDTYDTLQGVHHAVKVGQELKRNGAHLAGIRLDSGDLAYLSIEARKILDAAGLKETAIVASNDLDEELVQSLKQQGAQIQVWGVGTKLVTAYDQPALGGVYKLAAIQDQHGVWQPKVKLSEQSVKVSNPGVLQVRRYRNESHFVADCIFDRDFVPPVTPTLIDPADPLRQRTLAADLSFEDLLVPVMQAGEVLGGFPSLREIQKRAREQLAMVHPAIRRQKNPHGYPVGLEQSLHERKLAMIQKARGARS